MNAKTLTDIFALAAITGMRSTAGLAALALRQDGALPRLVAIIAAAEMIADKTSLIGARIAPLPLGGRMLFGMLIGAAIAWEAEGNVAAGGALGAATAVVAAHLGYRARTRLSFSPVMGGLLEDGLVVSIGAAYVARATSRS